MTTDVVVGAMEGTVGMEVVMAEIEATEAVMVATIVTENMTGEETGVMIVNGLRTEVAAEAAAGAGAEVLTGAAAVTGVSAEAVAEVQAGAEVLPVNGAQVVVLCAAERVAQRQGTTVAPQGRFLQPARQYMNDQLRAACIADAADSTSDCWQHFARDPLHVATCLPAVQLSLAESGADAC